MSTYALWIIPTDDVYDKFKNLILNLSLKYSAPDFEPHITLISQISGPEKDVSLKASELSYLIKPFKVRLIRIKYTNEYYRCIFAEAEKSEELMNANLKASEVFNIKEYSQYMPHLSLFYGNFPPAKKEGIISEIGGKLNIEFEVKSIHLISASQTIDPKYWHRVKEFSFI